MAIPCCKYVTLQLMKNHVSLHLFIVTDSSITDFNVKMYSKCFASEITSVRAFIINTLVVDVGTGLEQRDFGGWDLPFVVECKLLKRFLVLK